MEVMGIREKDEERGEEEEGYDELTWRQFIHNLIYYIKSLSIYDKMFVLFSYIFSVLPWIFGTNDMHIVIFICLASIFLFIYFECNYKSICWGFIYTISVVYFIEALNKIQQNSNDCMKIY